MSTLKEYRDVFAWSYKDLKGVDPDICQHTIPMKDTAKPSQQRPYTYNDNFAKKIKEEVSPIVRVPKKNGKLRVCVNLKKVNAATIRDHYPLPLTEHVLERVAGKQAYSFLDGFSGYNQVSIKQEDQHKTAFATEWGIYAYRVMPFGLTNAPSTFQRLMCHAFKEYLRIFLEVFMDDLCVHSLLRQEHIQHLSKVFDQCRLYRICLNPDKCKFMVWQGKILGHIVSANGIATDHDKIEVIVELPRPLHYKGVQIFMGHCGYYRRFIFMYAEVAKPLYALLVEFEWTEECEESFLKLKKALTMAPILRSPDWNLKFHVHIDASNYAIGCVLAQPHEGNMDLPVSYASRQLNSAEKNFTTTKREGLAMIYAVKKFWHYLLANTFIFYVDHQALLYLVNKPCNTGGIVRWFIILLEFDFTVCVRPGKSNLRADHLSWIMNGEAPTGVEDNLPDAVLFQVETAPKWSEQIIRILSIDYVACILDLDHLHKAISSTENYTLIAGRLYRLGEDNILRLCIDPEESEEHIAEAHVTIGGFHACREMTESCVRCNGLWWPTISRDVANYIKNCPACIENEPIAHVTFYVVMATPHWAEYIKDYLQGKSLDLPRWRKKLVAQEATDYELIGDQLYKRGRDGVLRLCVPKEKYLDVLKHAHAGISGGHFSATITAKTVMWFGLWWPTLHLDAEWLVARCEECQKFKPPRVMDSMPLKPIMSARAFAKWGIDFVGSIKPPARGSRAQYVIVAIDYLTKWVEAKATPKNDARTTAIFLYENVFTRYGLPIKIVSDQGVHFVNEIVEFLLAEFMITHKRSAPYHPQTNGLAESTNKTLCTALTKVVSESRSDWAEKLHSVL